MMADVCEDFESEEFDCRKVKVSVLEKALKWASGKIYAMCREFNGWQSEMRRTSGEEEPPGTGRESTWSRSRSGDLGVLALHGKDEFPMEEIRLRGGMRHPQQGRMHRTSTRIREAAAGSG